MKKLTIYFCTAMLVMGLGSCELGLENPAGLPPEVGLQKIATYRGLVTSAYRRLGDFTYYGQQAALHGDVLADNTTLISTNGRYQQDYVNAIGAQAGRWGLYVGINEANFVIDGIPTLTGLESGTEAERNRLLGEAYFLRALYYFELHRVYGYEPGKEVDGFNLGVILRTTPTLSSTDADLRPRSTNVQGYELMEDDLLEAVNLLPEPSAMGTGEFPFRASKMAARAILARLYLYWGNYTNAAAQADLVLAYTQAPLTTAANWNAAWGATPHTESIFEVDIRTADWSSVDGQNNSLNSITTNMSSSGFYTLAASAELLAAHETGDVRRSAGYIADGLGNIRSTKWRARKGSFVDNVPVIRRAEVLLITAEAKARAAAPDETGALAAVNTLRAGRNLGVSAATGAALITLIMNERRVELAFEGHRFYDLKRNGLVIEKNAATNVADLPYDDFRVLSRIPIGETVLNPQLEQNPEY